MPNFIRLLSLLDKFADTMEILNTINKRPLDRAFVWKSLPNQLTQQSTKRNLTKFVV